jgi:hypothetical protein
MPRLGSNADIFSRRGDPWISGKDQDGTRLHRREAMSEREAKVARITGKAALTPILTHPVNPDMDRWTKAGFRTPKHEAGQDKPTLKKASTPSSQRRMTNIVRSLKAKTQARRKNVAESESVLQGMAKAVERNRAEKEVRIKQSSSGFSLYVLYCDGTEEERDRPTKAKVDLLFGMLRRRRNVRRLEIWSYVSGDMLTCWERWA